MKTCTRCGSPKSLDEFVKDKRRRDGHTSRCLACERLRVKAWNQTLKGRAYIRQYHVEHPRGDKAHYARYKSQIMTRVRKHCAANTLLLASFKDRPCMDCGGSFPVACMDFDHVRGEKKFDLSDMKSHSQASLLAEVAKCDVVCACCHRIRTEQSRSGSKNPYRRIFRERVGSIKSVPCVDCGESFPPVAMDLDHVRGEKQSCVSNMHGTKWARALDRLNTEVTKCDVVCARCHRLRTESRRTPKVVQPQLGVNLQG
jgi:hypothetical protein